MIAERIFGFIIYPEAIIVVIIVLVVTFPRPAIVAFDTKMVVGYPGQLAVPAARFKQALRQCNTGGYAIQIHFLDSYRFKMVDIFKRGHRLEAGYGFAILFLYLLVVLMRLAVADEAIMHSA